MEGVRLKKVKIEGATGEISRILASVDYYAVLEVERSAESAEIKKAYRTKQVRDWHTHTHAQAHTHTRAHSDNSPVLTVAFSARALCTWPC